MRKPPSSALLAVAAAAVVGCKSTSNPPQPERVGIVAEPVAAPDPDADVVGDWAEAPRGAEEDPPGDPEAPTPKDAPKPPTTDPAPK